MDFSIRPKTVLITMLCIIACLAALHIAQLFIYYYIDDPDIFDFVEIIDFDYEANLPSYYSSAALMFASLLLWIIGRHEFNANTPFKNHWIGLAIIFMLLSVDEAISLHEDIGDLFEDKEWVAAKGFLFFAWVVPYGVLMIFFAASYFRFVMALPSQTKWLFVCAGLMFVSGAMGVEVISAREADMHGSGTILYSALYTVEELLEMSAIAIFCYASLQYIQQQSEAVSFHIVR